MAQQEVQSIDSHLSVKRKEQTDHKFTATMLIGLTIIILIGSCLRLHLISEQILLDDEWHSLYYVRNKTFGYLLNHFFLPGATCIPQNIYNLALLKTTGWSELLLRLPSILAGILAIGFFPFLVKPVIGRRPALLFTAILAISPFLVFYSRVARPYSIVVALEFAAVMFGFYWLHTGRTKHLVSFLITGVMAIEFHLFALPTIISVLATGYFWQIRNRLKKIAATPSAIPSLKQLTVSGVILAALLVILQGTAVYNIAGESLKVVAQQDVPTLASLWDLACMLCGTANPVLVLASLGMLLLGLFLLCRTTPLITGLFLTVFLFNFASMYITQPRAGDTAIVISRYLIVLYPISYMLMAVGLGSGINRLAAINNTRDSLWRKALQIILPTCLLILMFINGPWTHLYARPNNFTNHSVFQQNYRDKDWDEMFRSEVISRKLDLGTIHLSDLSPIYHRLRIDRNVSTIVEFPMMIGDHLNPYYFFQHFHRKRVLIGYDINGFAQYKLGLDGCVFGDDYVDEVLNTVKDRLQIRFSNMVDMTDLEALK